MKTSFEHKFKLKQNVWIVDKKKPKQVYIDAIVFIKDEAYKDTILYDLKQLKHKNDYQHNSYERRVESEVFATQDECNQHIEKLKFIEESPF